MVVLVRCFVALLLTLPVLVSIQGASNALTKIESRHGAWAIRCTFGNSITPEVCGVTNRKRAFLDRVRVQLLIVKGGRRGNAVVRLSAPSSIKRETGASLMIDREIVGIMPFVNCDENGCLAQSSLGSDTISQFRTGNEVTVNIESKSGQTFKMSVPLRGFGEAFDNLP